LPWEHVCLWRHYSIMVFYICLSHGLCPPAGLHATVPPTLRLFVSNSLQPYCHFIFSEGCACNVLIGLTFLSVARFSWWLPSYCSCCSLLRPLILSGSLIRCEPVQMYHHHPRSRIPLHPVHHIVYQCHYTVQTLPWGLDLG
jgi:hypothetical protein